MDMRELTGSVVALVTPFKADGSVDFDALARLVDFHLQSGTDAILTLGTTGESATMTDEEDNAVVAAVENSTVFEERLNESVYRVLQYKQLYGIFNP